MTDRRTRALALAGAIVVEVAATLALKASLTAPGWLVVTVAGYVCAFVLLSVCLRLGMPIGVAYGIWGAAGVFLTAVLATVIFREALTPVMAAGLALIIGGVLLVETGSRHPAPDHLSPSMPS